MRIPLADARPFSRRLLRGRALRLGLGAAIAGLAVTALVVSLRLDREVGSSFGSDEGGVLVLDVSTSIGQDTHRQIAQVLREASRSGGRFGLVVYSDTAYEALPPGTPSVELGRFARFFGDDAPAGRFGQPLTPWVRAFTSGTKISTGLELARDVLRRDRIDGGIVLVSDLEDDQNDVGSLTETLISFRRQDVPLRVVGLSPAPRDRRYFEELLPPGAVGIAAKPGQGSAGTTLSGDSGLSVPLIAVALLALLGLAANEFFNGRLAWRPS